MAKEKLITLITLITVMLPVNVGREVVAENDVEPRMVAEEHEVSNEVKEKTYMEVVLPRNLNYNIYDLREPSGVWVEELDVILKDTGLEDISDVLKYCEDTYHVNALFLLALVSWESSYGTSDLAIYKNNLTGYMAYNENSYESAKYFRSKAECVETTARLLAKNYLNEEGAYFEGFGIRDVNKHYCLLDDGSPDFAWSEGISKVANEYIEKLNQLPKRVVKA